jgi:hypothetical protein
MQLKEIKSRMTKLNFGQILKAKTTLFWKKKKNNRWQVVWLLLIIFHFSPKKSYVEGYFLGVFNVSSPH